LEPSKRYIPDAKDQFSSFNFYVHKQLMKCRYVTKGKELLSQLKTGDIIKSAKLVSGLDRFVAPTESG
jgi:hypothetical protein